MHKPHLLIGTHNPGKMQRRSSYFGDLYTVLALHDCQIVADVEETMDDLHENSRRKALVYAERSGYLTLSEDTGFFIDALDGQPWPAVRRRWGELPDDVSDAEFLSYFKEKIAHLDKPTAYFEYVVTLALPNGTHQTISHKSHGYIDPDRLSNDYVGGYPLSNCFVNCFDDKTRSECTPTERAARDALIIQDIKATLQSLTDSNRTD